MRRGRLRLWPEELFHRTGCAHVKLTMRFEMVTLVLHSRRAAHGQFMTRCMRHPRGAPLFESRLAVLFKQLIGARLRRRSEGVLHVAPHEIAEGETAPGTICGLLCCECGRSYQHGGHGGTRRDARAQRRAERRHVLRSALPFLANRIRSRRKTNVHRKKSYILGKARCWRGRARAVLRGCASNPQKGVFCARSVRPPAETARRKRSGATHK